MTSRKLMITQTTSVSATCRLRWISGSARTTMVVSTAVMRTPAMITTMARPVLIGCSAAGDAGLFCSVSGKVTFLA